MRTDPRFSVTSVNVVVHAGVVVVVHVGVGVAVHVRVGVVVHVGVGVAVHVGVGVLAYTMITHHQIEVFSEEFFPLVTTVQLVENVQFRVA